MAVLGQGIEQDGLDAAQVAVHLGQVLLVLKVLDEPHAAHDEPGPHLARHVHGHAGIGDDLNLWRVLEDALNQYRGAILLVSHDEMFVKNIKTDIEVKL